MDDAAGRTATVVRGKIRHIAIACKDPWKAAEFYMQAFGLEKVGETNWENASGVYLSDGVINLALLHYKNDKAAGVGRDMNFSGLHHIGFWVDDVAGSRRNAESAGATYMSGEAPTDSTAFYEIKYLDPDGNIFDITGRGWLGAKP
jgi:catechol 2,3-dioxygenase-like lactoylglutathione lyase family enzyme